MAMTYWERRGWQAAVLIAIIPAIGALRIAASVVVPVLSAAIAAAVDDAHAGAKTSPGDPPAGTRDPAAAADLL